MKRIGLLLSGCGVRDGSEIHEATLTLYFLDQRGVERIFAAPDMDVAQVVDHQLGRPVTESRSVLSESARIARGPVRPLADLTADELDALILPGGFGAASNLCDYAVRGRDMRVRSDVARLLLALHAQRKPIGAICIAPVVLARVFGDEGIPVELTIGSDPGVSADIVAFGARHVDRLVDEIHVDREHRVVSTPAYMLGRTAAEIGTGIERLVDTVVKLA